MKHRKAAGVGLSTFTTYIPEIFTMSFRQFPRMVSRSVHGARISSGPGGVHAPDPLEGAFT